jgi:hypothetical protein
MNNILNIKIELLTNKYNTADEVDFLSAFQKFMKKQGFDYKRSTFHPIENKNNIEISVTEFTFVKTIE